MYKDALPVEIEQAVSDAWKAFSVYSRVSFAERAAFMRAVATEIEELGEALITQAQVETQLPAVRLRNERARTVFQLRSYADACEQGTWMDVRIDTANAAPARPDIRKTMVPLGPVVVFGAANFPFAYSTAGGDTASAFAAGCPVIVKAHPAHAATSELVATAIHKAVKSCSLPPGLFVHLHGASHEVGRALVEHPLVKAAGFTGSQSGGRQLFDWATQRKEPIPVFAEMSSINPVFLLPGKIKEEAAAVAQQYAASVTLGTGQFCTNPGLLIGIDNHDLQAFAAALATAMVQMAPGDMLHAGIYKNYVEARANALAQEGVELLAVSATDAQLNQGIPTLAATTAAHFIANPLLHQEVFGPYTLLVKCRDMEEMLQVAGQLEGQLTATLMATADDIKKYPGLKRAAALRCGRLICNGVPTGVEVCPAMQHGGPYPATTDSRFTAVGADAIRRFARPLAFQNWDNEMLPDELKDENPLNLWRMVNNELTKGAIERQ